MSLRSRPAPCRRPAGAAGFTLLEMLVVLAILTFSLVLVVGYRPSWSGGYELDTTAAELVAELRLARSQAILSDRPAVLQMDLAGHRYQLGAGAAHPLPAGMSIELLTTAGERRSRAIGGIRFNPDGSSTGGRIVLAAGARRVAVGVDWLTGRVSVADVR